MTKTISVNVFIEVRTRAAPDAKQWLRTVQALMSLYPICHSSQVICTFPSVPLARVLQLNDHSRLRGSTGSTGYTTTLRMIQFAVLPVARQ